MRTWLLTGVPHSGTSLCCRLADRLPGVVALSEPIPPRAFAGGPRPRHRLARALLRLSFVADALRLRGLGVRL